MSDIQGRVKKIVAEQLGVKEEEVLRPKKYEKFKIFIGFYIKEITIQVKLLKLLRQKWKHQMKEMRSFSLLKTHTEVL